ncbi:MAG: hypothetical protein H6R26_143 [Proteobacteria bacterium]|nr:hypothetical protein [Pseudomonadota bacterium]
MKKTIFAMAMVLALGGFSGLTQAEEKPAAPGGAAKEPDSLSLLRASLRMDKREFIKNAMDLNEKDAEKFWSIYHQYEGDLMKLYDRRLSLIQDYAAHFNDMSEEKAGKLAKTAFELHKSRISLVETYYKKVAKALSNKAAVRFAQVENVLGAATELDLGSSVPLMPKQ